MCIDILLFCDHLFLQMIIKRSHVEQQVGLFSVE